MDSVTNYFNFGRDIKNAFGLLINAFDFNFYEVYEGCYELKNQRCVLRFTFDRGDISCNIKQFQSKDPYGYGIYPILRYLFKDDKFLSKGKIYDSQLQLIEYADIIDSKLKSLLKGDFSWLDGYLASNEKLNKMIAFIWNNIDKSAPIYIKFKAGDMKLGK